MAALREHDHVNGTSRRTAPVPREIEDIESSRLRHQHDHPPVRDLNAEADRRRGTGQRIADDMARMVGSWTFVIVQLLLLGAWVALNLAAATHHWDPYPFLFLNLVLSLEAALAASLVLMVHHRLWDRERVRAEHDYELQVKLEEELKSLMTHLENQDGMTIQVLQRLDRTERELGQLLRLVGLGE